MLDVLKSWVHRFLSVEEAVLFAILVIVAFVLLVWMGSALAPVLTGIVLAFLMQGFITFLSRKNIPDWIAISLSFAVFLGGFIAVLGFIIPLVWAQMARLFAELPHMIAKGQLLLELIPQSYPNLLTQVQVDNLVELIGTEVARSGQLLLSFSISKLPVLLSIIIYLILVPVLVFFFLKDKDLILSWFYSCLPDKRPLMNKIGAEMNTQMANYVRGKVIEIIVTGIVTYVLFKAFNLHYAALLAFFVGLSVIVPYIGVAIVTVPVCLIAYFQWGLSTDFAYLMLGYTIIQALDGMVFVPLLFSEAVNLHPVVIITAVLFFGSLWGLWGVFFAIPLATLVKSIMRAWPQQYVVEMAEND